MSEINQRKNIKSQAGITLIALVVSIIVMLLIVPITITMISDNNGTLRNAQKAKIMTELSEYLEDVELFKLRKLRENIDFDDETLTAWKNDGTLKYNTKPQDLSGNIKTIIPNISNQYIDILEVIKGELLLITTDQELIQIAQSIDLKVMPYDIKDGVLLSSNKNLHLAIESGTVTIPASVTKIGEGTFSNIEGLKTLIIPGTVKEIAQNAFVNNSTLETVIMEDGVRKIGKTAFKGCTSLTKVVMANSIIELEEQAFYGDTNLSEINISTGLATLPAFCFDRVRKNY